MHLTDPERKFLGERPCLRGFDSVVPAIVVWPKSHDVCLLNVMLPVASNSYANFSAYYDTRQLPSLLESYRNDPEQVFYNVFGWEPPRPIERKRGRITLEDLGL